MNSLKFKTAILAILDGWGIAPASRGNAITSARLPNYERLLACFPHTKLLASGKAVGLLNNDPGNTEIGHLNITAGRVVQSPISHINEEIKNGAFFENQAFQKAFNHLEEYGGRLHLLGLFGSGHVHASNEHLFALLKLTKKASIEKVYLHLFTDGRDSSPTAALSLFSNLENYLKKDGRAIVASICGRFYAMDRDRRWERTKKAYAALRFGLAEKASSATTALKEYYQKGITDEFIPPTVIDKEGLVQKNDAVIFYNHRGERARQLTQFFLKEELNLFFVTLTEYDHGLPVSAVAFPPQTIIRTLGEIISQNKLKQLRLAESEKERFVTHCFNGFQDVIFPLEERIIVPSPQVATYDQKPEMSAFELTDKLITALKSGRYAFIVINFANPDMVGHSGLFKPTVQACEAVDICLGKIAQEILKIDRGRLVVTSDHGNAEEKIDLKTGLILTEHTSNPVPFILVGPALEKVKLSKRGILADVAPTVLDLMGLPAPKEMTGKNLIAF